MVLAITPGIVFLSPPNVALAQTGEPIAVTATAPKAVTTDWYTLYARWEAKHGDRWTDSLDGGEVAWGESYVLWTYIDLYEAFGETIWLDKLVAHTERIFANLRDEPHDPPHSHVDPRYVDGFYGWGQSRYEQYRPQYTEWFCDDGLMISPILRFVEIVWNNVTLHDRYRAKADAWIGFIERYIVLKWYKRWQPDPGWAPPNLSRLRQDRGYHVYEWAGWKNPPLNMYLAFTDGLVTLHRLSQSPYYHPCSPELPGFYREASQQMLQCFRDQMHYDDKSDLLVWKYGVDSAWPDLVEDVGHSCVDIRAAIQGVRSRMSFSRDDLRRMANCFVRNVWNGRLDDPRFHYYLDGSLSPYDESRGHWGFGFVYLAEFDYLIWNALAEYFERHIEINQEPHHVAVTAAALACVTQRHDQWPPDAPRNLHLMADNDDLKLSWDPPISDAGGGPLTGIQGYWVYRSDRPDGIFTPLHESPIKSTCYIDANAATGTFYYRVAASDYRRPANMGPSATANWTR